MKIPDDVTILWSDDNSGNIQRLPIPSEVNREGNAGVYYHFDYVGSPRNYKWINTIQLSKTWEQMHLAWAKNATEIWIVNVGDLKPLVFTITLTLDASAYRLVGTSHFALPRHGLRYVLVHFCCEH